PLREPGDLERVAAVGPGNLAAEPRRRHHLAGVRALVGIEGAAELLERSQVVLAEHLRHVALLVDPDAVLAGDRASRLDAGQDNLPRQLLGPLRLALRAPVVADKR